MGVAYESLPNSSSRPNEGKLLSIKRLLLLTAPLAIGAALAAAAGPLGLATLLLPQRTARNRRVRLNGNPGQPSGSVARDAVPPAPLDPSINPTDQHMTSET